MIRFLAFAFAFALVDGAFAHAAVGPVYPGTDASAALVTPSGATAASTLASIAGRVARVDDFGAVGDGYTDDTAAINAAISTACPGGTVQFSGNRKYYTASGFTLINCTADLGARSIAALGTASTLEAPSQQYAGAVFYKSDTSNLVSGDRLYFGGTCTKSGPQSGNYSGGTMGGSYTTVTAGTNFTIGANQAATFANLLAYLTASTDPNIAQNTYTSTTWSGTQNRSGSTFSDLEITSKTAGSAGRTVWGFSTATTGLGTTTFGLTNGLENNRAILTQGCGALTGADLLNSVTGALLVGAGSSITLSTGARMQNGYIASSSGTYWNPGPAATLTGVASWVNNGTGITLAGPDTWVSNVALFGFNEGIGSTNATRATIEHVRCDSRNCVDIYGSYDWTLVNDVISNNWATGGSYNPATNGGSTGNVDTGARSGNLIMVRNGGSGTTITNARTWGHSGVIVAGNDGMISCTNCKGDGPNSSALPLRLDFTMTSTGSGYTSVPSVSVSPAITGAIYSAQISAGSVVSVSVVDPGQPAAYIPPYTLTSPSVTISGGGGSGATATAAFVSGVGIQTFGTSGAGGLRATDFSIAAQRAYLMKTQWSSAVYLTQPYSGGTASPLLFDVGSGGSVLGGNAGQITIASGAGAVSIVGVQLACLTSGGAPILLGSSSVVVRTSGNVVSGSGCNADALSNNNAVPAVATPTTGQTVQITAGVPQVLNPAGTLATLTVQLPGCSTGSTGLLASFSTTQAIAALTVSASAGTVTGAPASAASGASYSFRCLGTSAIWYPSN